MHETKLALLRLDGHGFELILKQFHLLEKMPDGLHGSVILFSCGNGSGGSKPVGVIPPIAQILNLKDSLCIKQAIFVCLFHKRDSLPSKG